MSTSTGADASVTNSKKPLASSDLNNKSSSNLKRDHHDDDNDNDKTTTKADNNDDDFSSKKTGKTKTTTISTTSSSGSSFEESTTTTTSSSSSSSMMIVLLGEQVFNNDDILLKIIRYAASDSTNVKSIRAVNQNCRRVTNSNLRWIGWDWMYANGHHELGTKTTTKKKYETTADIMESLEYYEACVNAGIFEKKTTSNHKPETLVPKSVSRILLMEELLQPYPRLKIRYNHFVSSRTYSRLMDEGTMIFGPIVKYLVKHGILPSPKPNPVEHIFIKCGFHRTGPPSSIHPIYNEYWHSNHIIPYNIFAYSPEVRRECLRNVPCKFPFFDCCWKQSHALVKTTGLYFWVYRMESLNPPVVFFKRSEDLSTTD